MKRAIRLAYLFIPLFFLPAGTCQAVDVILTGNIPAQVYFSPDGGATAAVIKAIGGAKSEILIQAYTFRSPAMAQALIDAHKKGVKVELLIDKSERQEGLTPPTLMANAGIPVHLDGQHAVANNRVIVIDRKTVITGSFNFNSASEEMNAENLLIMHSKELSAVYRDNWLHHRRHADPF